MYKKMSYVYRRHQSCQMPLLIMDVNNAEGCTCFAWILGVHSGVAIDRQSCWQLSLHGRSKCVGENLVVFMSLVAILSTINEAIQVRAAVLTQSLLKQRCNSKVNPGPLEAAIDCGTSSMTRRELKTSRQTPCFRLSQEPACHPPAC